MLAAPEESREATLSNAPTGLGASLTFRIIDPPTGDVVLAESAAGISEVTPGVYVKTFTAPATKGQYLIVWRNTDTDVEAIEELEVAFTFTLAGAGSPFATLADIQARLGRSLTTAENDQVDTLLQLATGLIIEAVDKTQDWADALEEIPGSLRLVCIEAVVRVLKNPAGAQSTTETLGAFSHTERFDASAAGAAGLFLTELEERRVRRAVYGTNSGGGRASTIADHLVRDWEGPVYVDDDPTD